MFYMEHIWDILRIYTRFITSHYKDPGINQPGFHGMSAKGFDDSIGRWMDSNQSFWRPKNTRRAPSPAVINGAK